jgi:hypothetical protein
MRCHVGGNVCRLLVTMRWWWLSVLLREDTIIAVATAELIS